MAETKDTLTDKILSETDIVELISEVTPLEKKGKNHMGLCPFHQENTPSFSVSEDKQLYHCFSCKASGNAITFVKETKNLESRDAIKYLADRANITLDDNQFKADPLQKYYDINAEAEAFYKVYLHHTKSGQKALEYLYGRELDLTTIEHFGIGLAPAQSDALYQAMRKKEILKSDLLDLGLIGENESVYDVFRNRIMFPLHDEKMRVVGFSGRTFTDDAKTAKYVNSTSTATFEKSKVLYNLGRARKTIREKNRAVLFEGFMDVIKAHTAGLEEGIATMGTALTKDHIKLIRKHTDTLVLCFDGDDAGLEATRSMINALKNTSLSIYVAKMPYKKDPDDFISEYGKDRFNRLVDEAMSADEFVYEDFLASADTGKLTDIERFKKQVFNLIERKSNVEQVYFLNKLAEDLNLPYESLELDFKTVSKTTFKSSKRFPAKSFHIADKFVKTEIGLIHYFLKDRYYSRKFRSEFEDFTYVSKVALEIQLEIFEIYDLQEKSNFCIVPEIFRNKLSETQRAFFDKHIDMASYPFNDEEFEDMLLIMNEFQKRSKLKSLREQFEKLESDEEKIKLKYEIDRLNREVKHGKRKNNSRVN